MNWRKIICWLRDHKWEVIKGKRHCTACDHETGDGVRFCPKCGSEKLMLHIWASAGYQFRECQECGHKLQDTSETKITITHDSGCYELEKPVIDQDGNLIEEEREE